MVNEYSEFFSPSYSRALETETKLNFKFDKDINKRNPLFLNFEEIFLLINWF